MRIDELEGITKVSEYNIRNMEKLINELRKNFDIQRQDYLNKMEKSNRTLESVNKDKTYESRGIQEKKSKITLLSKGTEELEGEMTYSVSAEYWKMEEAPRFGARKKPMIYYRINDREWGCYEDAEKTEKYSNLIIGNRELALSLEQKVGLFERLKKLW